jgi:hypothetical protein
MSFSPEFVKEERICQSFENFISKNARGNRKTGFNEMLFTAKV